MPRGLNIELAEKVLKQVTEHPETHNQKEWGYRAPSCGTQVCLAGWAVVFAYPDAELVWRPNTYSEPEVQIASAVVIDGERLAIAAVAAQALNLDDDAADELFLTLDAEEAIDMLADWIGEAKRAA